FILSAKKKEKRTRDRKSRMEKKPKTNLVAEEALMKIWARFSLRSIARFRSVCKEWKSMIDSDVFRDLYES
ncbi:unnamed protein product, partial [Arabidopsis halleri]